MESEQSEEVLENVTLHQPPPMESGETSPDPVSQDAIKTADATHSQESANEDSENVTQSQFHSHMAQYALKVLLDGGISVVEYGSQLRFRCGYAEILTVIEYAVPDDQLLPASQTLTSKNMPLIRSSWRDRHGGIWSSQSLSHDLDGQAVERVVLFPLSLVGLTLEETIEVPSTFDKDLYIRTPKPPRYFLSLLRHLLRLPVRDLSRDRIEWELHIFIAQYIMHGLPAHTPRWVVAAESEESYQQRIEQGVREMKTWDWGEVDDRMLDIAERAVREIDYVRNLTDVVATPLVDQDEDGWNC